MKLRARRRTHLRKGSPFWPIGALKRRARAILASGGIGTWESFHFLVTCRLP